MLKQLKDKKVIFFDVGNTLDRPASGHWMFTNRFLAEAGDRLKACSREEYARLIENVKRGIDEHWGEKGPEEEDFFVAYNTICSRVANRATRLEEFARGVDAVLFVSGQGSSNGHYLYEYCRRVQPRTYLVYGVKEQLRAVGAERIGITGATSTPRWLMEAVAENLRW